MGYANYASAEYGEAELARPWPRFWARIFDVFLYSIPASIILALAFPSFFAAAESPGANPFIAGMVILPLVMVLDAVIVSLMGTSPGKAIAGLYVAATDESKLNLETSLKRGGLVYLKGLVLGLPLLNLIGYASGYSAVKENGVTSWDQDTDSRVYSSASSGGRTVLVGVLAVFLVGVMNALAKM